MKAPSFKQKVKFWLINFPKTSISLKIRGDTSYLSIVFLNITLFEIFVDHVHKKSTFSLLYTHCSPHVRDDLCLLFAELDHGRLAKFKFLNYSKGTYYYPIPPRTSFVTYLRSTKENLSLKLTLLYYLYFRLFTFDIYFSNNSACLKLFGVNIIQTAWGKNYFEIEFFSILSSCKDQYIFFNMYIKRGKLKNLYFLERAIKS